MSATSRVPSSVPSLIHGSLPCTHSPEALDLLHVGGGGAGVDVGEHDRFLALGMQEVGVEEERSGGAGGEERPEGGPE